MSQSERKKRLGMEYYRRISRSFVRALQRNPAPRFDLSNARRHRDHPDVRRILEGYLRVLEDIILMDIARLERQDLGLQLLLRIRGSKIVAMLERPLNPSSLDWEERSAIGWIIAACQPFPNNREAAILSRWLHGDPS
jgi:hypothetical protein